MAELRDGLSPAEVVALLDEKISPFGQVWVDGGRYDAHWLDTLCEAALRRPAFALGNLRPMLEIDGEFHARYALELARSPAPHRAGPDAERICNALLRAGFLDRFVE